MKNFSALLLSAILALTLSSSFASANPGFGGQGPGFGHGGGHGGGWNRGPRGPRGPGRGGDWDRGQQNLCQGSFDMELGGGALRAVMVLNAGYGGQVTGYIQGKGLFVGDVRGVCNTNFRGGAIQFTFTNPHGQHVVANGNVYSNNGQVSISGTFSTGGGFIAYRR